LFDEWASKSAREKKLLEPTNFIAQDVEKEKEWKLPADWSSGQPRAGLLEKYRVFITPSLKKKYGKGYVDIEELVKTLGAKSVTSTTIRKDSQLPDDTIIMALPQGDLDAITLHNSQHACYDKEFLTVSILRGQLTLDEFKLNPVEKKGGTKRKTVD
jgi:hypothetical protein